MSRPFALALQRLGALGFAVRHDEERDGALAFRRGLLAAITDEPTWALARSATRFAYTMALCEDIASARRYAIDAIQYRLEQRAARDNRDG
jgi:hypothetical protein